MWMGSDRLQTTTSPSFCDCVLSDKIRVGVAMTVWFLKNRCGQWNIHNIPPDMRRKCRAEWPILSIELRETRHQNSQDRKCVWVFFFSFSTIKNGTYFVITWFPNRRVVFWRSWTWFKSRVLYKLTTIAETVPHTSELFFVTYILVRPWFWSLWVHQSPRMCQLDCHHRCIPLHMYAKSRPSVRTTMSNEHI